MMRWTVEAKSAYFRTRSPVPFRSTKGTTYALANIAFNARFPGFEACDSVLYLRLYCLQASGVGVGFVGCTGHWRDLQIWEAAHALELLVRGEDDRHSCFDCNFC